MGWKKYILIPSPPNLNLLSPFPYFRRVLFLIFLSIPSDDESSPEYTFSPDAVISILVFFLNSLISRLDLMAFEQSFVEPILQFDTDGSKQKKSESSVSKMCSENATGCFDCNICLESAHDPVVTLCGHLYCWPCIYKWLHIRSSSHESEEQPQCPVCKAYISKSSLVPLYGRGSSLSDYESKKFEPDFSIPQRPPALGTNMPPLPPNPRPHQQQLPPNPFQQFHHQQQYFPQAFDSYASIGPSSFAGPTVGMFGEMFFARMFGSPDTTVFAYPSVSAAGGPRMRRQEMQVEKSLNRLSIFLWCCLILCLLLF